MCFKKARKNEINIEKDIIDNDLKQVDIGRNLEGNKLQCKKFYKYKY